jgi:F0F1-type ATP synthase delta subunit
MKHAPHIYAKALVEVLENKKIDQAAAKNFITLVRRNGDEAHLGKILEEAGRIARGKSGVRKVTVSSARELTKKQEAELKHFVKSGDVVEKRIEPELIAGVKITLNDELQFDGSLKKKLDSALRSAL